MYIYEVGIVDNYRALRLIDEIIDKNLYYALINCWGTQQWNDYEKIITSYQKQIGKLCELSGIVESFARCLFHNPQIAESLKDNDLIGIYAGLVPLAQQTDDCYLPYYFVFRLQSNGTTIIVSESEL